MPCQLCIRADTRVQSEASSRAVTITFLRPKASARGPLTRGPCVRTGGGQESDRLLVAAGLFTSQEEIANSPKQRFGNYTVGDIKYRDLNGDGIVDGNDVTTAGSPTVPEIQYGIGATVKWRRLDFSFMFQGASNVSLRMYNMHPFCDASHFGYGITQYIADNHWSEDNNRADAAYPRLTSQLSSNNTQSSTFYIHDAKYLRLKTVELGYTIKKLRVYLSGNNLFVISPFDYWDPEKGGGHGLSYPLQRTAKIGVQYQF